MGIEGGESYFHYLTSLYVYLYISVYIIVMGSIESALPTSNGKVNESPLNRADEVADVSLQSAKIMPDARICNTDMR